MTQTRTPARSGPPETAPDVPADAVPWRATGLYVVLALGLAWLAALPLWLGEGLQQPGFMLIAAVVMTAPAIAGASGSRGDRCGAASGGPWGVRSAPWR
jgi:hypothetical protein